jgi:hypothetical protein
MPAHPRSGDHNVLQLVDDVVPVAAEFLGQARALVQRLAEIDDRAGPLADDILARARDRWRKHPSPRDETLRGIERRWRDELNSLARLDFGAWREARRLKIVEIRAAPIAYTELEWESSEPGIAIAGTRLLLEPGRFTIDVKILATVGLHSLARRYQRAFGVGADEDVVRSIADLARHRLHLKSPDQEFAVPDETGGGEWRGSIEETARHGVITNVRTYVGSMS